MPTKRKRPVKEENLGSVLFQSDLVCLAVDLRKIVIDYLSYPALRSQDRIVHQDNNCWAECLMVLTNGRVVGGHKVDLRVWDVAVGAFPSPFCLSLVGHTRSVMCLAELPDGSVVSGAADNTLRIWDTDTGECRRILPGLWAGNFVSCVVALPDGRVVSGGSEGTVRVWDVSGTGVSSTSTEIPVNQGRVDALSVLRDGCADWDRPAAASVGQQHRSIFTHLGESLGKDKAFAGIDRWTCCNVSP